MNPFWCGKILTEDHGHVKDFFADAENDSPG
jgi:hypothetical protein